MEQNINRIDEVKRIVGIGSIALCGLLWLANMEKVVPVLIFGAGIWMLLAYAAWVDWKTHQIHDAVPLCVGLLGGLYCVVTLQPLSYWGMGLLTNGIVMGMLYTVSRKSIGLGDVKLLIALGIYLGPLTSFYLLFHASWMGALAALAGMALKRMQMGQAIPFVPFIAAGYLLALSSW